MPNTTTILTLCVLFAASSLLAQNATYGLQAGVFISTPKMDEVYYDFSGQVGFSGGIFFRIPLTKNLSFQPEASYVRRPVRAAYSFDTYNALDPRVVLDYSADQNLLELGGLLRREIGVRRIKPFVAGGMAVGFLTDKKATYTRDGAPYATTAFTHNDVSVLLESGVSMATKNGLSLSLGLRYSLAFNYQERSPLSFSRIGARHHRFLLQLGVAKAF